MTAEPVVGLGPDVPLMHHLGAGDIAKFGVFVIEAAVKRSGGDDADLQASVVRVLKIAALNLAGLRMRAA